MTFYIKLCLFLSGFRAFALVLYTAFPIILLLFFGLVFFRVFVVYFICVLFNVICLFVSVCCPVCVIDRLAVE